jgi:hypothetical protein
MTHPREVTRANSNITESERRQMTDGCIPGTPPAASPAGEPAFEAAADEAAKTISHDEARLSIGAQGPSFSSAL